MARKPHATQGVKPTQASPEPPLHSLRSLCRARLAARLSSPDECHLARRCGAVRQLPSGYLIVGRRVLLAHHPADTFHQPRRPHLLRPARQELHPFHPLSARHRAGSEGQQPLCCPYAHLVPRQRHKADFSFTTISLSRGYSRPLSCMPSMWQHKLGAHLTPPLPPLYDRQHKVCGVCISRNVIVLIADFLFLRFFITFVI